MNWYCEHLNGRRADIARNCKFLDGELSDGAVLTSNAGKAGAWYFDDDVDTRPTTVCGWKTVEAHACACKCESECPVLKARKQEVAAFVAEVTAQGVEHTKDIWHELNHYIMTKNNPYGCIFPRDIQLDEDCAYEAAEKLRAWWKEEENGGAAANNGRQSA